MLSALLLGGAVATTGNPLPVPNAWLNFWGRSLTVTVVVAGAPMAPLVTAVIVRIRVSGGSLTPSRKNGMFRVALVWPVPKLTVNGPAGKSTPGVAVPPATVTVAVNGTLPPLRVRTTFTFGPSLLVTSELWNEITLVARLNP